MDDNALAQDYILTIETMKNEILSLRAKLGDSSENCEDDSDLQQTLRDAEDQISDISEEITNLRSKIMETKVDEEWISEKCP